MNKVVYCRALIVAETRVQSCACIGALNLNTYQSLRLLKPQGFFYPLINPFEVGHIWTLRYQPSPKTTPPHVEDVFVQEGHKVGAQANMREFLLKHAPIWQGGPQNLFDGTLRPTNTDHWYCNEKGPLPAHSSGYWLIYQALSQVNSDNKIYYNYETTNPAACAMIRYVGCAPATERIPANSLVRVSLARWFQNSANVEPRCYLQLSGWYA